MESIWEKNVKTEKVLSHQFHLFGEQGRGRLCLLFYRGDCIFLRSSNLFFNLNNDMCSL